ncbi:hypothetical protein ABT386_33940, partial [Streptomyces halstedii]
MSALGPPPASDSDALDPPPAPDSGAGPGSAPSGLVSGRTPRPETVAPAPGCPERRAAPAPPGLPGTQQPLASPAPPRAAT